MRISRPSPAMGVALIALVMSTTGTAIATSSALLPRDSVGAAQLRAGSVQSAEIHDRTILSRDLAFATIVALRTIADGSIGGSKLASDSIDGSKIMSGSIGAGDLVPDEAWQDAPLAAGWGSSDLGFYARASFRKDRFGVVHLRGVAWRASNSTASVMFTLPVGYRPAKNHTWPVASGSAFGTYGTVDVESGGNIYVYGHTDDTNVSLDGIEFVAGE